MGKLSVAGINAAAILFASSGIAQVRDPDVQRYRFVSDLESTSAIWVNPAVAGFNRAVDANAHFAWNRPVESSWRLGQYLLGLQSRKLGFGYQHDEFDEGLFSNGDAYTLAMGFAVAGSGFGVSRTWRSVGESEGSWNIGLSQISRQVTAGLVWRDIGSPRVRGVVLRERFVSGVTYRVAKTSLSGQLDYQRDGGEFRAFRVGAAFRFSATAEALVTMEWDGDGDFAGLNIGAIIRQGTARAAGVAGLDGDLDARVASGGLKMNAQRQ